jgi:ribonuclease P protein component
LRARDFREIFRSGSRSDGRLFLMIGRLRQAGPSRLGLAVDRRLGGAVRRNRVRRRLRECFRHGKPASGLDLVLVAKREMLDVSQRDLEREYARRLAGLERRLARGGGARPAAGD